MIPLPNLRLLALAAIFMPAALWGKEAAGTMSVSVEVVPSCQIAAGDGSDPRFNAAGTAMTVKGISIDCGAGGSWATVTQETSTASAAGAHSAPWNSSNDGAGQTTPPRQRVYTSGTDGRAVTVTIIF